MFGFFKKKAQGNSVPKEYYASIQIRVDSEKKVVDSYRDSIGIFSDRVTIVDSFSEDQCRKYVYSPKVNPISSNQFRELLISLMIRDFDYVFVSSSLDQYPVIGASDINDAFIYDVDRCPNGIKDITRRVYLKGKILRVPGIDKEVPTIDISKYVKNIRLIYESFLVNDNDDTPEYRPLQVRNKHEKKKKMVFVMPIFMAVGGVERNTVEIMRALQSEYEFVVITMERHSKEQGSLNYQLEGLCVADYDLRELVEFQDYLDVLTQLREIYNPDVVWLCNNSPWLEEHLLEFREVFKNQKIVAQDVYDTKFGWIEYYNTEGIKSLDSYIAVNEKIKETFINKYALPEEKIEVIYSAIDDNKVRKTIEGNHTKDEVCEKYGLDKNKKHFALIGRMTEQKNPIRYLEMINGVKDKYKDIQFLLVGDGVLSESVDQYIEQHELRDVVKRILFVDSTPMLFQGLDGLVLTSIYEGLAIVSIEAMSIGVPIISTDTGDLRLFLEKTKGGVIIDESKPDTEQFASLMSNYDEYKKNAVAHGKEILDFFSASNIAKQYINLFEK